MNPRHRMLLIGAAVIVAALLLNGRQGRRLARAVGGCCPMLPGWSLLVSNAAVQSTNATPGTAASDPSTNRQR